MSPTSVLSRVTLGVSKGLMMAPEGAVISGTRNTVPSQSASMARRMRLPRRVRSGEWLRVVVIERTLPRVRKFQAVPREPVSSLDITSARRMEQSEFLELPEE